MTLEGHSCRTELREAWHLWTTRLLERAWCRLGSVRSLWGSIEKEENSQGPCPQKTDVPRGSVRGDYGRTFPGLVTCHCHPARNETALNPPSGLAVLHLITLAGILCPERRAESLAVCSGDTLHTATSKEPVRASPSRPLTLHCPSHCCQELSLHRDESKS